MADQKIFKIKNSSGEVAGNSITKNGCTYVWQEDGTIEVPESMLKKFLHNKDNELVGPVEADKPVEKVAKKVAPAKLGRAKVSKRSSLPNSPAVTASSKKAPQKFKK